MNLECIFPTPIWEEKLSCDLYGIKTYIKEQKQKNEGRKISNVNGWQSDDYSKDDLMSTPICQFVTALEKKLKLCFADYGSSELPVISNVWFNINPTGAYNTTHIHTDSFLSGVFYIQSDEDSGDIIFERSSTDQYILGTHIRNCLGLLGATHWKYSPKPNKLLIFPGWVPHSVGINNSNKDRISISFNILK